MKRGFTVIEFMIIVCIIAIISGIAVPVLLRERQRQQQRQQRQQIPPAAIKMVDNQFVSTFQNWSELKTWMEANKWNTTIQSIAHDSERYIIVFTQVVQPVEKPNEDKK